MKALFYLVALSVLSFALAACNRDNGVAVASGATPAIPTAIGPIPGGGTPPAARINPFAGNEVALVEGRKLFNWYNCSGCHGGHAGGGMGPSLRDEIWLYGNRDDQIFDSIAQGRAHGMPTWGTKVPEQQIWKLVAYIKSMRTPQEPDPPLMPEQEGIVKGSINSVSEAQK
jgi:cytochrome c oxidase cbb3-type subunit 3